TKKSAAEPSLLLRLRIRRAQDGKEFLRGDIAFPNAADRPLLTLKDQTGAVYRQRGLESVLPKEKDPRPPPFPVALIDEVFTFEAPPRGVSLRVEVPTACWGGKVGRAHV